MKRLKAWTKLKVKLIRNIENPREINFSKYFSQSRKLKKLIIANPIKKKDTTKHEIIERIIKNIMNKLIKLYLKKELSSTASSHFLVKIQDIAEIALYILRHTSCSRNMTR